MTDLPLSHLFVLDLTAHRAGPTAVRQLADWGAKVIRSRHRPVAAAMPLAAPGTASISRTCIATSRQ